MNNAFFNFSPSIILSESSPLESATRHLMSHRLASAVIEVCLVAASNFGGSTRGITFESDEDTVPDMQILPWESNLYQTYKSMNTGDSTNSIVVSASTSTNPESARKKCYDTAISCIDEMLSDPNSAHLADAMLGVVSTSLDEEFHHTLYKNLVANNNMDTLLRFSGSILKKWLHAESLKNNDAINAEVLWRYFTMHGDHMEAGRLIIQAALSTEPLSIEKRSSYLSRALGSYSTLEHNGSIAAHQLVEEVQNYVDVLNVQSRINAVVESNVNLRGMLDAAGLEQLSKTVVSADDLLNDFAAKLQMWDFCLIIIHCCRKRDVEFDGTIQKLWYTIMSEILPSRVEDPSANQIAAKLLQRIHDQSIVEKQDRGGTFETGAWITSLKTAVITLGSELYGSGADHTFPVTLVLGELESLRRVFATISCSDIFRDPWPLQAFLDIGCPYIVIVQAYDSLLSMAESEGAEVSER